MPEPVLAYVPTCPGNSTEPGGDALCPGATTTCPNVGDTRFWVYVSSWDPAANTYGRPVRRTEPPTVCLGPQEAAKVDPRAAVAGIVRAQWRTFGLPAATVTTRPQGQTLVNAVTLFASPVAQRIALPPRDILGFSVTLTVTATQYVWDFGDGSTLVQAAAGTPAAQHVYRTAGGKTVSLRTRYTAVFTIAGDPTVYPLDGVADVPGPPAALVAREARSQLEAGH